jgi:HCOMODA/2-hydroxy-3-carboxy-muconic semialdehyde decarboxylase
MNRRKFLGAAPIGALLVFGSDIAPAVAQSAVMTTLAPASLPATDDARIAELVVGNHILADQGVVDAWGHISVRSAKNPKHYFLSRSRTPELVTRDDIMEFDEHSQPVDARGRALYGERFIHGEIYAIRPDVFSVVHCHTNEVLPFTVTKAPLKAVIHTAYFLGTEAAPIFELREVTGPENLMLVNDAKSAAALARTLGDRSVVLLRGHGEAVAAPSIRDAVFRTIYTKVNAQVELDALRLGEPVFMNQFEVMRVEGLSRQWEQWAAHAKANR